MVLLFSFVGFIYVWVCLLFVVVYAIRGEIGEIGLHLHFSGISSSASFGRDYLISNPVRGGNKRMRVLLLYIYVLFTFIVN